MKVFDRLRSAFTGPDYYVDPDGPSNGELSSREYFVALATYTKLPDVEAGELPLVPTAVSEYNPDTDIQDIRARIDAIFEGEE